MTKVFFFVSIVLLELWFNKSFEALQGTKPFPREKYITKGMAEFVAAKQLIEELDNGPGEAALFTEAVHRCSWGLDCNSTGLTEEYFKNKAHHKIVC